MDIRNHTARYYDLFTPSWKDAAFYQSLLPSPNASVLELGCGTGRVLVPLAKVCGLIQGLDLSEAMLEVCRQRIAAAGLVNATVHQADITEFDLGRQFDLITAPYRVMQNLASDRQVQGLLACIRRHLAPGGVAVLNAFSPKSSPDALIARWGSHEERGRETAETPDGLVIATEIIDQVDVDPLVLRPELIYRLVRNGAVVDEVRLHIAMRVWYPDEFEGLITNAGFSITGKWGGYEGEPYGEPGGELVLAFADRRPK